MLRMAQIFSKLNFPQHHQPARDWATISTRAIWGMQFPHAEGSHSRFAGRKMNQTELGHWRKDPTAVVRGQGQKLRRGMSGPAKLSPLNLPQRLPHALAEPTKIEMPERCGQA